MRNVLKSHSEVAHFWANKVQTSGRAGSIFFEGSKIYSWGRHYIIADIIEDKKVVLFNSINYSNSTAKHKSIVVGAIDRDNYKTISVPGAQIDNYTLVGIESDIRELLGKAARARTNKEYYLSSAQNQLDKALLISKLFDRPLTEQLIEWSKNSFTSPEAIAKIREEEKIKAKKRLEKNKEKIQEWITGERNVLPNLDKIFLRCLDGKTVETTLHAEVPLNQAKALYNAIKANKPVHGVQIGHYTVSSFTDKVLTIGCHKLEVSEINRFAALQNW